jgi:lysophospholipase L1-like esterase
MLPRSMLHATRSLLLYSDLMAIRDEQGEKIYRPDGLHLTASGHAYVADQLEHAIGRISRAPGAASF